MLAENVRVHDGRCQLSIPDVCTGEATQVHHVLGRAVTGDDPRYLVAACAECNVHVGDPAAVSPPHRPVTRW